MDMTLVYGLVAAFAVSVVSLIGVVALVSKRFPLTNATPFFLSLAAGAMVGNALFHLIPEGFEHYIESDGANGLQFVSLLIVGGFFAFFAIKLIPPIAVPVLWRPSAASVNTRSPSSGR